MCRKSVGQGLAPAGCEHAKQRTVEDAGPYKECANKKGSHIVIAYNARREQAETFIAGDVIARNARLTPYKECANKKAPSARARRVKKICLWHIFSQSGKQAMLVTRAEGWRRRRLKEYARL